MLDFSSAVFAAPEFGSENNLPEKWKRLPGSLQEASAFSNAMKRWTGRAAIVYDGPNASEKEFFEACTKSDLILISTHGFFRNSAMNQDPLNNCGFVLSNANKSFADKSNDGIVTGLEILNANLKNTKLVILSACDTANGESNSGDSISSLRHAFELAGARSIVAASWRVDDNSAAKMIGAFVDNVASGDEASLALQKAQKEFLKQKRIQNCEASIVEWAAFSISGVVE